MEVVYPCSYGLDVHKKSITARVLWAEAKGKSRKKKKRFSHGADYFDRIDVNRIRRSLVGRPERLGHRVTLEPLAQTA